MNWDELPISSEQAMVVGLVAALIVSATLAPMFLLPSSPTEGNAAQPTATPAEGETYEYTEQSSSRPDEIGDLHEVPDSYTKLSTSSVPAPDVKASAGSQTMQVTVRKEDGEPVIDLTDDRTHKGRWVSLDTKWFKQTLGGVPEVAYIRHESGDQYAAPITVRGGQAVFFVQEFSTNTVTFDGTFNLTATPAADGDQFTYNASDGGENLAINVTGATNSEYDNESASGVVVSSNQSISVGGNKAPVAGDGGDPILTVTGHEPSGSYDVLDSEADGTRTTVQNFLGDNAGNGGQSSEVKIQPTYSGKIETINFTIDGTGGDYTATVDVYLVQENPDQVYGEGTKIASFEYSFGNGLISFSVDNPPTVSAGTNYTLEFVTTESDGDGSKDYSSINTNSSATSTWFTSTQDGALSHYGAVGISYSDTVDSLEVKDGNGNTVSFGSLNDSETVSKRINLSLSSSKLNWTGTGGGSIDYQLEMKERTQTVDPVVELNSASDSYTGTLADGETVSLSINDSAINNGTNTVNVSVGDGTLSADAPTPQVNLKFKHDIPKQKSVTYQAETWSERYSVSRTWEEDTENATLKIPWASDRVVALRNAEVEYIDETGTLQSTDSSPEYYFTNTGALVVKLGDVPAGWKTTVDVDGSKVQVRNGSIVVTQPTAKGESLDTKFKVESKSSGFKILVGGTANGKKVHFVNSTTTGWDDSETALFKADGTQAIRMPNAQAGETGRMHTIPLKFAVDTNEVVVSVPESSRDPDEPVVNVKPGGTSDDTYSVTFVNAADGKDYVWFDQTNNIVIDSGTASSPLTLSGTDTDGPLMQFMLDMDSTTSGDGGGGGGGAAGIVAVNTQDGNYLPLIGIALVLAGLFVASRREDALTNASDSAGDAAADASSRLPVIGAELGKALDRGITLVGRGANLIVSNRIAAGGIAVALLLGAVRSGLIVVPEGAGIILVVGGFGIGSLLFLREIDSFSRPIWVGVNGLATLVALEYVSDQGIIAAVSQSRVFPLVAIGALYLGYRLLKLIRQQVDNSGGGGGSNTVTVQVEDGDSQ